MNDEPLKHSIHVMHLISSLQMGGAERLLVDLLKEAARSSSNLRVHYTVVVMNRDVNPDLGRELASAGVGVYCLGRPEGHLHPRYLYQLLKIIRRHHVQVLHVHNRGSKLWGMLCKLLRPSLNLVMTVHNTNNIACMGWLERFLHCRLIDCHIAISCAVAAECEIAGLKKYEQIYNGIALEKFEAVKHRRRDGSGPVNILNVARLEHAVKGQDVLIDALRLCRDRGLDFRCRLVGGVYEYNRDSYDLLCWQVSRLGLDDAVSFEINRTDIPDIMADAGIFVLPSRLEGLGLVVLEAMAAGLPVVASCAGGIPELVEDGVTGLLFEPGNAGQLADALIRLSSDAALRQRLAQNAEHFVQDFGIAVMKNRYHRLYQGLLCSRRKTSVISLAELRRMQDSAPV